MEPAVPGRKISTSRALDFVRPERREKYFALAVFFMLTGLVSLLGEFFLDGDLAATAELLAADSGGEVILSLAQPSSWLVPGLLVATFALPVIYAKGRVAPVGSDAVRPWIPSTSDKVPI
jgi:hypothetical protein